MALKRPHAVSFSKKNEIHPFTDASSLEFWSQKNDASFFVVGQSSKKRPNNLVLARMFDGNVLDMCELGIEGYVPISEIPVRLLAQFKIRVMCTYDDFREQKRHRVIHH
jgi:ribosome production factor 2